MPDELKSLIDDAEVVSFDVFDTLLLRRHYAPTDVFEHASPRLTRWFRRWRIAAEIAARRWHRPNHDVTLKQIYAFLHCSPDAELSAEQRTLFANPAARPIYDYAVEQGKRIIAVTDMYLPHDFLRTALERAGYTSIETIYVSNEIGSTKHFGHLFDHVAADLALPSSRILHIGDNAHSDVARARERGFVAWQMPSARDRFEAAGLLHPSIFRYLRSGRHPDHSLLLGLLRDRFVRTETSYSERFGFAVAGPALNAFCDWITEQARAGGHQLLQLIGPEAGLLRRILAIRHPELAVERIPSDIHPGAEKPETLSVALTPPASGDLPHPAAYFALEHRPAKSPRIRGWFALEPAPLWVRTIAPECVDLLKSGIDRDRGVIEEGAVDFTRVLRASEDAGYPIRITREDVAHILRAVALRPTEEDRLHNSTASHEHRELEPSRPAT